MTETDAISALDERVTALARQVARLEDTHAVKCLHYKYGYYIDKCLYDEAVALFADSGEVRFLNGVYRGRAGLQRLYCNWFRKYFTGGMNGPLRGLLLDHLMLQDIVDVAEDGRTAKGRFRCLLQGGCHESMREPIPNFPRQFWEAGIYESAFVKEEGVWKIQCLHYNMLWRADHHQGWANSVARLTPFARTWPDDPNGPDELLPEPPRIWPETWVVPFHYPHPVTGKRWGEP